MTRTSYIRWDETTYTGKRSVFTSNIYGVASEYVEWSVRCTSHKVIFKNAKSLPGTNGSIPNSITPNYRMEINF